MKEAHNPLPNLVIAGVVKAGTTSVFTYLSQHPRVCPSSVKETQFFLPLRYDQPLGELSSYLKLFERWHGEQYIMEATPGYFEGGRKLALGIRETVGESCKVLLILRNPVDRLLSFYKYKKAMLDLDNEVSLEEYVSRCREFGESESGIRGKDLHSGITTGNYIDHLPGWYEVFGNNVKTVFFDDLNNDRIGFMRDLCAWLELDSALYERLEMDIENRSRSYRSRSLQTVALALNERFEGFLRRHPRLKQRLRDLYSAINSNNAETEYRRETLDELNRLFQPKNRRLREFLEGQGLQNFPSWLE